MMIFMTKKLSQFPHYRILSTGKIVSLPRLGTKGGELKPQKDKQGYLHCRLYDGRGNWVSQPVHRLVLEAYRGKCPKGCETRHLDGNPQNNNIWNLQWGTPSENSQDTIRHENHAGGPHKLHPHEVKVIDSLSRLKMFKAKELAFLFHVSTETINAIKYRKNWRHLWM